MDSFHFGLALFFLVGPLLSATLLFGLRERGIRLFNPVLKLLRRPLSEVLVVLFCVGGLVHLGSTKVFLGSPSPSAPAGGLLSIPAEPPAGGDAPLEAGTGDERLHIARISRGATNDFTEITVAWGETRRPVDDLVYVFGSRSLDTLFPLFSSSVAGFQSNALFRVYDAEMPTNGPVSRGFYSAGDGNDTDGDGLPNIFEVRRYGTDPADADTDGDGLPDGWEAGNGLDPADAGGDNGAAGDPDHDGLTNIDEYQNGCAPREADTDGDGVGDATEVGQDSNPNDYSDGGAAPPQDEFRTLTFNIYGDYAAWEMTIKGLGPEDTRVRRITMGAPDAAQYVPLKMRKGNSYRLSMRWLNCSGHEDDYSPWYCWQAQIDGLPEIKTFPNYSNKRRRGGEIVAGDGWIAENGDGLLTRHVDAHYPDEDGYGGGNVAEGLVAMLYVLDDPLLIPDYNRDGIIDDDDEAMAANGTTVFRFWINDDEDSLATDGKYSESPEVNIPSGDTPDYAESGVDGLCDLLDFTPVLADASRIAANLPGAVLESLDFRLSQGDGALNAVWSNLGKESANAHLKTGLESGFGALFASAPESAPEERIASDGCLLPTAFAERVKSCGGIFLVEGRAASSSPMWFEVLCDGEPVCSNKIFLSVSPVENMYRTVSLRDAADNPSFSATVPQGAPSNQLDGAKNLDVFFMHGFNVDAAAARAWGAEIFKRLWQSGSNARFHLLPWRGDYNWLSGAFNGLHYQHDVWFAQRTAAALKRYAEAVQPDASKRILMTHSLGNMVACEALREGLHVGQYYMFDAAVPSEAIDTTLQDADTVTRQKYVPTDWRPYTNLCWASNWFRWFADDPNDVRGQMGWPGRFTSALANADEVFNYYSSGDEVFHETPSPPWLLEGIVDSTANYCWQKQETLKGRRTPAGTDFGGWGFHLMLGDVFYSALTAADAVANGSVTNYPVFDRGFSPMFNRSASLDEVFMALAKCVPAVSSPAGGNAVLGRNRDFDLNSDNYRNGWGRPAVKNQTPWLHSDMKDMAFFYVYKLYEQLIQKGNLK